jgi:AcrR family transcriptional regulator
METTSNKGERTRQAIIEAAYGLFSEQGFHATSMRQIAQAAGIALGGIYNHFESKEQIFDEVLLEKHPYRQVLPILMATSGDTIETFAHNAAQAVVTELGRRPDFLKLVFIELSEFKGQHTHHLFNTIFPQFLPLIERFQHTGDQVRDLSPQAILLSFLGMFFSYYLTESVANPNSTPPADSALLEQHIDIFLHGILKSETR